VVLNCSGSSRGARKGYNKLAGEESEVANVNCTAPQCVVQESSGPGHGPGPGDPDSSDTNSNCSDVELEEEISDDSDYGKYSSSEHQRPYSTLATRSQIVSGDGPVKVNYSGVREKIVVSVFRVTRFISGEC
jgi:hypothetical protein